MPETDIERIVRRRVRLLHSEAPGTVVNYDIRGYEDIEWGIITVTDELGRKMYVEFVESSESLALPEALDRYAEAAADGPVLVVVPDDAQSMATELLFREANPSIALASYAVVGITLMA
jgi:hypothetical protein